MGRKQSLVAGHACGIRCSRNLASVMRRWIGASWYLWAVSLTEVELTGGTWDAIALVSLPHESGRCKAVAQEEQRSPGDCNFDPDRSQRRGWMFPKVDSSSESLASLREAF